ncbi:Cell division control protein 2 [Nosema bombycis CQ1]|uniref:Cyclin-dependent kinase 1 n=1 Tax=Nosema bombycis (strain CQ1 / CVCC 102059) TaxID=578461 RepID=R0KZ67_NOSB1|nr:Cell division control protein 2 [Nosema bombycis CQ1]|eukprot:EOB15492.1 Cell division control protein 2 [Nosema bombycis CQ1]
MSESFQKLEKIGEGTYGVVYKTKEKKTGKIVALKKIRLENESEGIPPTTIREIILLKNLKHSTIISLKDVIYNNEKMYLVFEFIDMDLRQFLDKVYTSDNVLQPFVIKKMAHQLITAIYFCHSKNIFHRDLKPQNILVDSNGNLKLADFGLGRLASVPLRVYTSEVVTLWYRSPELLLGVKYYDSSVDVWSAACIIAEIILLKPLFPGDSEIDQLFKIFKILGTPNNKKWHNVETLPNYQKEFPKWNPMDLYEILDGEKDLIDMISKMLIYDPIQRYTAQQSLEHKYFKGVEPIHE